MLWSNKEKCIELFNLESKSYEGKNIILHMVIAWETDKRWAV
jgi:hypothetical protein